MRVSALNIYPVKSLRGIALQESEVTPMGLKWDRFWMVVNDDGQFMSQRNLSEMAEISTAITDEHLVLSHPKQPDLTVPLVHPDGLSRAVKVWKSECQAVDEGEQASNWLTSVLGKFRDQRLHLVRMALDFDRLVSQNHTQGEQHHTYFADGYPFLVVAQSSLEVLNSELQVNQHQAVSMDRFRGNIELAGSDAFAEHKYQYLTGASGLQFHLCKPCERCKVITLDQLSGEVVEPQQPLKTLFQMQHVDQKGAFFGQNAVVSQNGCQSLIKVGDEFSYS